MEISLFFMVHLLDDLMKVVPNPMKSIWKPEKSMKLKKLVFRMFLEGTYGVALRAKELSDVKADSRAGDLDDVTDLVGENVLPMLKTMNYTLSVTSWTKRRPQPLFLRGKRGRRW